jgi:hypothetical protein
VGVYHGRSRLEEGGGLLCDKEEKKGLLRATVRRRPGAGREGVVRGEAGSGRTEAGVGRERQRAEV